MKNKKVIPVSSELIAAGIKKYKGEIDAHMANVIKYEGLSYTPYVFADGRVLLVLPNKSAAFLYDNEDAVYEALSLSGK